ncbi:hypothetical protein MYCTH_95222 [Thermothelomyces thermophilus ATCC 42464]|uniref:Uncharacterized protein n=1 Tax=Thermothelomyces thermophilus (strain ATCC 42464 / BCRC 31852 / DSM 1799) TaxID=573729 RepID=G2QH23_THET4|nr:uncharacterized protein MYCTH_95222 [Thermothelomyces thermophilus ATCC 42464]AEO58683.1 hypothetical protein MYCTH_95222 [Thermothelomyces thermophilus ATCC 42464]
MSPFKLRKVDLMDYYILNKGSYPILEIGVAYLGAPDRQTRTTDGFQHSFALMDWSDEMWFFFLLDIVAATFAPIVVAVQMVGLACCDREYSDALDILSRRSSPSDQTEVWFWRC